jgi:LDH2 family malate/lactate/ureidoglycolate dehydrogenase
MWNVFYHEAQYQPNVANQLRVKSDDLKQFLEEAFSKVGLPREQVHAVVTQLVTISLRGVDTHGVYLAERYLEGIKSGQINIHPKMKRVVDGPSVAVIDGDKGLGAYLASEATKLAIDKAKKTGIGAVNVAHLTHCGALSYYGLKTAESRMAGIFFTSGPAMAAPWGGATPVFSTNPLCFSFPSMSGPIVLDMATTTAAGMKIQFAIRDGKQIPLGWALDRQGRPTTDPSEAFKGVFLPFGEYKGYGLMFATQVYSTILGGGKQSFQGGTDRYFQGGTDRYFQGGFYVQAIDIGAMRPYSEYLSEMKELADRIHASKLAEGFDRVYLPGELELITADKRQKEGIPLAQDTLEYFEKTARELNIELPTVFK